MRRGPSCSACRPSMVTKDMCALVMGELASLYLDAGKTEAEFVAAMQFAFRSVKAARDAIAAAAHPPEG